MAFKKRTTSNDVGTSIDLAQSNILDAIVAGIMKAEDSRLILEYYRLLGNSNVENKHPRRKQRGISESIVLSQRSKLRGIRPVEIKGKALFYPSAGNDLLTPILLGLPFCEVFYFYDRSGRRPPNIWRALKQTGATVVNRKWEQIDCGWRIQLELCDVNRTIYWINQNNLKFLDEDIELGFYFHRGDSQGEGGSNQYWDSKLLPELLKKVPEEGQCLILSDGEPGGIDAEGMGLHQMDTQSSRGRVYSFGSIK